MAELERTFSESWYRVAPLHIQLRPQVRVHRQRFRGELWFVLEDPYNNQFFRLRPEAWELISRLGKERTVEEAWKHCLKINPEAAPGQTEIIRLLSQLYQANLIFTELPADVASLFRRFRKRRQRETQSKLMSFMFARFPLWDPDRFLVRALPLARWAFSRIGFFLWLMVIGLGLKVVVDHFGALTAEGRDVLAPGNLIYLYAGIVVLAVIHEMGHAFACRIYGGEVHTLGIMLLVFTPLPFIDASASWAFRERWKRITVAAAGMYFELFIAGLAALAWANTGPGLVHTLAYNLMFAASVSTLLFNVNPLLRFDGYYILADLLNVPNLYGRAQKQLKYLAQRYLLGMRQAQPVAEAGREGGLLVLYGVSSFVYRIFVFSAIIFFVGRQFLVIGVLLAFFCVVMWVVIPTGKYVHFLASSPALNRCRLRAVWVSVALLGFPLGFLYLVPFPNGFKAPGVVEAQTYQLVTPETEGTLESVHARSNREVETGEPLVSLRNPLLDLDLRQARARLKEAQFRRVQALREDSVNLDAVDSLIASVEAEIRDMEAGRDALTVRAPFPGLWVSPDLAGNVGRWIPRGEPLGILLKPGSYRFSAVISQADASRLFTGEVRGAEVRLPGRTETTYAVEDLKMIPMERRQLPSAALGFEGGGSIQTERQDRTRTRAAESFFEVRGTVVSGPEGTFQHGRSGHLRMELPPEPLLQQWIRSLRQLIQKYYSG